MNQPAPWVDFRDTSLDPPPRAGVSFDLPPEEAIAFFRRKGLKPTFAWQDMLGREHAHAFTVAKMMDLDLLADTKAALDRALARGTTFREFKETLIPTLQAKGWWGRKDVIDPLTGQNVNALLGSTSRLQTIFRTNLQASYSAGAWDMIEAQAESAPWLEYDAVDDHRTRPEHAEMNGTILPVEDPFWLSHYPPNGWNCRCGVIQWSQDELAARGLAPSPPPRIKSHPWQNPRTGKTHMVPDNLDPGWDYNAGKAHSAHLAQLLAEKVKALPAALRPSKKAQDAWQPAAGMGKGPQAPENATALRAAALRQQQAQTAAYKAERAAKLAAAENRAAAAQLKAVEAGTAADPGAFKHAAWKHLSKINGWDNGTAAQQLGAVLAYAKKLKAKHKGQTAMSGYKKNVLAGKPPTPAQQAALQRAPDDVKNTFLTALDDALQAQQQAAAQAAQNAQAAKYINSLSDKGAPILEKAALKKLTEGNAAAGMTPSELMEAIKAAAAAMKAKGTQAQYVTGYKKALVAGKIPSPAQAAAFNKLDDAAKAKLLQEVDNLTAPPPAPAEIPTPMVQFQIGIKSKSGVAPTDDALEVFVSLPPEHKDGILKGLGQPGYDAWALQVIQKATPPAPPPAPAGLSTQGFIQTGPQKGSNPGGKFQDPTTGAEYYIKAPPTAAHAQNEVLAGKLYELAGIDVPELQMTTHQGKPAVASRMIDGVGKSPAALQAAKKPSGTADGFAADAWLANWDVVGLEFDNLLVKGSKAYRVDTGGALLYRAQGTAKGSAFGNTVDEWFSLRDPGLNPQAATVFGNITPAQLKASALRVATIADDDIRNVVMAHGPGDTAARQALANTLIARKADLIKKASLTPDDLLKAGAPGPQISAAQAAQKAASEKFAASQVQSTLATVDEQIVAAAKGIGSRMAQGQALAVQDFTRAKAALAALDEFLNGAGTYMAPNTRTQVVAHYAPFRAQLERVVSTYDSLKPPPAQWDTGFFKGYAGKIEIDPRKVPLDLAPKPGDYDPGMVKQYLDAKGYSIRGGGGNTVASINRHATQHGVTDLEARALNGYTGTMHREINDALRKNRALTETHLQVANAAIAALDKLPKYQGLVSRGVDTHKLPDVPAFLAAHTTKDNVVRWQSFSSTSYGKGFSGDIQFKINLARGHANIEKMSAYGNVEKEVLMYPGSLVRIDNAEQLGGIWYIEVTELLTEDTPLNFSERDDQQQARETEDERKAREAAAAALTERSTDEIAGLWEVVKPAPKP